MRKKFKKAVSLCYSKSKDCVEIIFQSPASNQLRLQKKHEKRFGSYVQLKRYQKHREYFKKVDRTTKRLAEKNLFFLLSLRAINA